MRLALIGTGNVGRALAKGWAAAGHEVVLGSRDPAAKAVLASELGAPVVTVADAAAQADVIVNVTPGTESVALLRTVSAELRGKVLLDIAVGFTEEPHGVALSHPTVSLGEEIQEALPDTRVVKTLSTVDAIVMTGPADLTGPSTVFLSGNDAEAKKTTAALLTDLGWPESAQLDLGPIETARGQEHFALLFMGIAGALGSYDFGIQVVPHRGN